MKTKDIIYTTRNVKVDEKNKEQIISTILKTMKENRISQSQLARMIGTSQASISKMFNEKKGYRLSNTTIMDICAVLGIDYNTVESIDDTRLNDADYERSIVSMMLKKYGMIVSHVKICSGVVYRCNEYTKHQYFDGTHYFSVDQMDAIEKREKGSASKEELAETFDEFYEIKYKSRTKRLSLNNYHIMLDKFNTVIRETIDMLVFF